MGQVSRLLQPRMVVAHVVVVAIAVLFVNLGLWQLRRHAEVRSENDVIAARRDDAPVPLDAVLAEDEPAWRPVTATGVWRPAEEVLLTPRPRDGTPGHEVLTPLDLGDGRVLLVDRGWVPFADGTPPVEDAPPTSGEVTVSGFLQEGVSATRVVSAEGAAVTQLSAADTARLDAQVGGEVLALWLLQSGPEPDGALPRLAELPTLDGGPHLSYALQWFAFAVIGLVGYPLLLRRRLKGAH